MATNGTTKTIAIGTFILLLIGGAFAADVRVDYKVDQRAQLIELQLATYEKDQKQMKRDMSATLSLLRGQYIVRKTVLELRQASGVITPEERVELKAIKEMLEDLD